MLDIPMDQLLVYFRELIDGSKRLTRESELYNSATESTLANFNKKFYSIPEANHEERHQLSEELMAIIDIKIDSMHRVLKSEGIEPKLHKKSTSIK